MQKMDWIRREECPTDRRGAVAVLTDAGFEELRAAAPHHVRSVREHLFDQLTAEELSQLHAISRKLVGHIAEVASVCPDALVKTSQRSAESGESCSVGAEPTPR